MPLLHSLHVRLFTGGVVVTVLAPTASVVVVRPAAHVTAGLGVVLVLGAGGLVAKGGLVLGEGEGEGGGVPPGGAGVAGAGPLSRQWKRAPPGQPAVRVISYSREVVEAACTPYGMLRWSVGLVLSIAHVMIHDPSFLLIVSFHSDRCRFPVVGCGLVPMERYTGQTKSWPLYVHPRTLPHDDWGCSWNVIVWR